MSPQWLVGTPVFLFKSANPRTKLPASSSAQVHFFFKKHTWAVVVVGNLSEQMVLLRQDSVRLDFVDLEARFLKRGG